jgi:hypothetical protein
MTARQIHRPPALSGPFLSLIRASEQLPVADLIDRLT